MNIQLSAHAKENVYKLVLYLECILIKNKLFLDVYQTSSIISGYRVAAILFSARGKKCDGPISISVYNM